MIAFNVRASISDDIIQFIRSGNYEALILELMNQSTKFFPHQYVRNEDQSDGQCDFIDVQSGEKYEAKLVFTEKDGQLLAGKQRDFRGWVALQHAQEAEFSECISERGIHGVENLSLFKTMNDLMGKIEDDENVIFFIPYPIALDSKDMVFTQFASDILSAVADQLKKLGHMSQREVYAIYPGMNHEMVIRRLKNGVREYIDGTAIEKYIKYDFWL